jgi:hypothetical protein
VSPPNPTAAHEDYVRELGELLEQVLAGRLVEDWAAVERLVVRMVGAQLRLQELHRVDERGQCSFCWRTSRQWWRPWPRRITCTVHSALGFFLRQPDWAVLSVITDHTVTVRGRHEHHPHMDKPVS